MAPSSSRSLSGRSLGWTAGEKCSGSINFDYRLILTELISERIPKELGLDCEQWHSAPTRCPTTQCMSPHPTPVAPKPPRTSHPTTPSINYQPHPHPWHSVLMGANLAADIARGELSEATVAYTVLDHALLLKVR